MATRKPISRGQRRFWVALAFTIIFLAVFLVTAFARYQLLNGLEAGMLTLSDTEWNLRMGIVEASHWVSTASGLGILIMGGITILAGLWLTVKYIFGKAFGA